MRALIVITLLAAAVIAAFAYARTFFTEPGVAATSELPESLRGARVLAVFAHPDDEILITQYLVDAQKAGALTGLVTFTRGEAGRQITEVGRPEDTGVIRHAELVKHGWALGVDHQRVLEFPDGGLPNVDIEELAAAVSADIAAFHPDVIVTFDPNSGVTGHRDHRRAGEAATLAARRAAGDADGPKRLVYVLAPRKGLRTVGGEGGAAIADAQPEPNAGIVADYWIKLRAWDIHLSQRGFVRGETGLPAWLLYALWNKEYYAVEILAASEGDAPGD